MGYSCAAKANMVLEELIAQLKAASPEIRSTNSFVVKGKKCFYEIGREQPDSAITGTIMMELPDDRCRQVGTFRIDANGRIVRFYGATKAMKETAQTAGLIRYYKTYGGDWSEDEVLPENIVKAKFLVM